MRRLMWFVIGFAIACAGFAYLIPNDPYIPALICLVGAVLLFFIKYDHCRRAFCVLLGCCVGFIWCWGYRQLYLGDPQKLDNTCSVVTITATDYSYETNSGTGVDGKFEYGGKSYKVKLYLYDRVDLKPGDQYKGECRLYYTADGAKNDPTHHQSKGIYLLAYSGEEYEIVESTGTKLADIPAKLRHAVGQRIDSIFPADVAGVARALLLGDTTKISYETQANFSVSGISHIVAVSGLHVSILCSLISFAFFKQRHLTALIGIPVLVLFAAVVGFTPSVVRACLMHVLIMLSFAFYKEYDSASALAFSVLVILGLNPYAVTAVSFQLSVACMIGIFAFSGRIHKWILALKWMPATKGKSIWRKILRGIVTSVSVSLSVWIVTTPLCAIHFGMVSIVGILSNLLTVWAVSFIFCGIMLACVVSFLWLPLGGVVAWLVAWLMRYVQTVAALLAGIPYSAVYTCSTRICIWLGFCYVLLGLFILLRFKKPGILIGCMLIGLVIACTGDVLAEQEVKTRVSILDVGQGQCVLLKHNNRYYLIDCGSYSNEVAADRAIEYLHSKGIRKLDGLILTSYRKDHAGDVMNLLTRVEVDALYLPAFEESDPLRLTLEEAYADRIRWVYDSLELVQVPITIYCTDDSNSVLFQPDNYDILFLNERSSAGEQVLLKKAAMPELELLVLGHHGAKSAASYELLLRTKPQTVAISVGDNYYNHPAQEVLDRLDMVESRVYRTDCDGTLEFGR